jgi:Phage integrase SAM-like domain
MEPHYILKSYKDKQDLQVLQLVYFNKGKQVRLNSGIKVREKDFDEKSQKILASIKQISKDPVELNDSLTELKEKVNKIVREYRFQHKNETTFDIPPGINYVKYKFLEKAPKHEKEFDVLKNYELWLERKRKKIRDDRGYVTLFNDLKEFIGSKPVTFKDVNEEFLDQFLDFLMTRDLVNDTIKKKFKYLKTFLKGVVKVNHYKDYLNYDLSYLKGNKETENIYTLTDQEYELMKTFEVSNKKLMYARDLFLIGCNTSLRFSDIFELNKSNAMKIIDLTTQKTDAEVKLQVTPLTKQLLEKYDYNLVQHFRKPQRNSKGKRKNGLINRYLHE